MHELKARVQVMAAEKLALGVPCINSSCSLKITCERFYDPLRTENQNQPSLSTAQCFGYNPDRDNCHVLRRRLTGDPAVHREWAKTTKRHRRRGGSWA